MPKRIYYNKIVRDDMPEIIGEDGYRADTRRVEGTQLHTMLIAKLMEEVSEYVAMGDCSELGDVYEALIALAREVHGKDEEWLHKVARLKREQRGRISNLVLMCIEEKEA